MLENERNFAIKFQFMQSYIIENTLSNILVQQFLFIFKMEIAFCIIKMLKERVC